MKSKFSTLPTYQNEDIGVRLGDTLRRLRKCAKMSQVELARSLDLHQAAVCRVESGDQSLGPWHLERIAEIFGVRVSSFMEGSLDFWHVAMRFEQKPPFPERYQELPFSKMREILPLLIFTEEEKGRPYIQRVLGNLGLDRASLQCPDQPIGVHCGLDLLKHCVSGGVVTRANLKKIAGDARNERVQGFLHEVYRTQKSTMNLIKVFLLNQHHYDTNFLWEITDSNAKELTVAISPAYHMKDIPYNDAVLGDILCQYKKEYLSQFPQYIDERPIQVEEKECHFAGAARCIYSLKMA